MTQEDADLYAALSLRLKTIFTKTFEETHLWNLLHSTEFGAGPFVCFQAVQMAANMFGGKSEDVMGFVTSGGTESLMQAARAYRNWGTMSRGIPKGQCVILAGSSIHAALLKAGLAYNIKIVQAKADENGVIDMDELRKLARQYGNRVVAIFGSAPSYPKGKIDSIKEMSALAQELGCGMHVDCCLGGFIINHLKHHLEDRDTQYLKLPGVTSLSLDTHKNGWAPKGSGVNIMLPMPRPISFWAQFAIYSLLQWNPSYGKDPRVVNMPREPKDKNLAYYSIYPFPDWDGGVYGSASDPGSEPCVKALTAFFAMLTIGQNGYKSIAKEILSTTQKLGEKIETFEGRLKLFGKPDANVVAFAVDKGWKLEYGATYALANLMAKKGFFLNTIKGDAVHFCVTGRCIGDDQFVDSFAEALKQSLEELAQLDKDCKQGKAKFPGDAGIYCALDAAITPKLQNLGTVDYLKNMLLGVQGANDAVRAHFLALLNPYGIKAAGDNHE